MLSNMECISTFLDVMPLLILFAFLMFYFNSHEFLYRTKCHVYYHFIKFRVLYYVIIYMIALYSHYLSLTMSCVSLTKLSRFIGFFYFESAPDGVGISSCFDPDKGAYPHCLNLNTVHKLCVCFANRSLIQVTQPLPFFLRLEFTVHMCAVVRCTQLKFDSYPRFSLDTSNDVPKQSRKFQHGMPVAVTLCRLFPPL